MKIFSTLVLLLFAMQTAAAQSGYDPRRMISVTGSAEVMVAPDQVSISMSIETNNMSLDKAREENDEKVSGVLSMLKSMGIEAKYIQTNYLQVEPRYDSKYNDRGNEEGKMFTGYFMTKQITVVLKDISKFEKLIAGALRLGTNYVNNIQFSLSDTRKYKDEVRLKAVRAAKEKATAMAGELGQKVGKPLSISENSYQPYNNFSANIGLKAPPAPDNEAGSIAEGQISIQAEVAVTFELE